MEAGGGWYLFVYIYIYWWWSVEDNLWLFCIKQQWVGEQKFRTWSGSDLRSRSWVSHISCYKSSTGKTYTHHYTQIYKCQEKYGMGRDSSPQKWDYTLCSSLSLAGLWSFSFYNHLHNNITTSLISNPSRLKIIYEPMKWNWLEAHFHPCLDLLVMSVITIDRNNTFLIKLFCWQIGGKPGQR